VPTQSAANDSVFRWKLVASVVAVAAAGSVLWALVSNQDQTASGQLARQSGAPAPVVATATATAIAQTEPTMIRDPRLDELLAAHKQFGGASALQQPAGFLRNATFQPAGR
jgi:sigma-E factor negative regulatory protein RseA